MVYETQQRVFVQKRERATKQEEREKIVEKFLKNHGDGGVGVEEWKLLVLQSAKKHSKKPKDSYDSIPSRIKSLRTNEELVKFGIEGEPYQERTFPTSRGTIGFIER